MIGYFLIDKTIKKEETEFTRYGKSHPFLNPGSRAALSKDVRSNNVLLTTKVQ
jgi:hypothetical protein